MKKFLKLTTVVVSMVMALTFVSCSDGNSSNNGNENLNVEQLNLVGTYGLSKVEGLYKDSTMDSATTMTMPTSTSLRIYETLKIKILDDPTFVEMDYTITKTADGYSFNWAKYEVDGVAESDEAKVVQETQFDNKRWNNSTAEFAMTLTITADGKWSMPDSSGTYTVDKANSKVILTALIAEGETLDEPVKLEATYSNNGETLVVVLENSYNEETGKTTMTLTRK